MRTALIPPRVAARVIASFLLRTLGGPGSGNFGHAGRPGEVGGSAPGEGGPSEDLSSYRLPNGMTVLESYVLEGGFMGTVNPVLRHPVLRTKEGALGERGQKMIDVLDAEMAPLTKQETLFRVLEPEVVKDLEEGDEFTDNGFISTTRQKNVVGKIVEEVGLPEEYALLRITAPPGTKAIDVNSKLEKGHQYQWQHELVLARGTRFRVKSVYDSKSPPPAKVIEVRVIQ